MADRAASICRRLSSELVLCEKQLARYHTFISDFANYASLLT